MRRVLLLTALISLTATAGGPRALRSISPNSAPSLGGAPAPTPPVTTTVAASAVAFESMQLNGTGNPTGTATTGWFRYWTSNPGSCTDSGGTRAPSVSGDSLGAGSDAVAFDEVITGLTPGTTYYFCAIASNAIGTTFGAITSQATGTPGVYMLYPSQVYEECKDTANYYSPTGLSNALIGAGSGSYCVRSNGDAVLLSSGRPKIQCATNVSGTTGSSCYLLSEPARTNEVLQSEAMGTTWSAPGSTVVSDTATAPGGANTMDKITTSVQGSAHYQTRTVSSTNKAAFCIWFRSDNSTAKTNSIGFHGGATAVSACSCTRDDGGTATRATSLPNECVCKASIAATPTRVCAGGTFASNVTTIYPEIIPGDVDSAAGVGIFWGAMLRAGSTVAGSYIPTGASTVTSVADTVSLTSNITFDGTNSQAATVVFPEGNSNTTFTIDLKTAGGGNHTMELKSNASGQSIFNYIAPTGATTTLTSPTIVAGTTHRLVGWRASNTIFVSLDGNQTSASIPDAASSTGRTVAFGSTGTGNIGNIQRISKICIDDDGAACR